jgi:DNA topoisomerase-2
LSPNLYFEQISFVNGINTTEGGKHVDYVVNQITKKLSEWIKKKKKLNIKPIVIKENLIVFIKSVIDNPSFSSQTKETLTTHKDKFGSKCEISDKFIDQLSKCGIVEKAIELSDAKNMKQLTKTDGKKQNRLKGIPKLEDANFAGTKNSKECTLIITEGDSAKSSAMAGLEKIGRDKYGVFPLKGKVLNVRGISPQKIIENTEISNLKKIIGLQTGQVYSHEGKWPLRYGKLLILTDQDEDGSHIKGLVFNLFLTLWPSLYYMEGFLNSMLTPIVKCKKGKSEKLFYSLPDYEKFKEGNGGWNSKYYKGLGTSTAKESKEYFQNMKLVTYVNPEPEERQFIDLAFAKEEGCADRRKEWLSHYQKSDTLNYSEMKVSIGDFVNKDLKHFSNSDNIRSIPSMVDGLKPSQRKVLFGAFKRNLTKTEIKVAQLAGFVSEHTGYHHGEASLQGTIVNLAQNFVGSNNINLLEPLGQFGTRIGGGKDAAQPRYIFTKLCPHTLKIFNSLDNDLYKYNYDDATKVEPEYYVPVLPMVLINGAQGIGTGWSTDIPSFNPVDLVENMKLYMEGKEMKELVPFYNGFQGKIKKDKQGKTYISKGIYVVSDSKIIITELPVGMWTDKYKEFLETLVIDSKKPNKKQILRYYNSYCTDTKVHFELILANEMIEKLEEMDWKLGYTKLEKQLKLVSTLNTSNMVLYDSNNQIKKYTTPEQILAEFCDTRLEFYTKRKDHLIELLKKEINMFEIKIRFINMFIEDKIKIIRKSKSQIEEQLETHEFPKVDGSYDYLIKMPIYNLSKDKMDELQLKLDTKVLDLQTITGKSNRDLWTDDLESINIKSLVKNAIKKKLKIIKK